MSNFFIDKDKAKAALLYVVNMIPGVDEYKLYEILYFAEQYHLVKYGRPVMSEIYEKTLSGLVPIMACNEIVHDDKNAAVELKGGLVTANEQPDLEELSISDLECLDLSIAQNRDTPRQIFADFHGIYRKMNLDHLIEDLDIAWHGKAEPGMMEYIKIHMENSWRLE